jgi:hypothetical protein
VAVAMSSSVSLRPIQSCRFMMMSVGKIIQP